MFADSLLDSAGAHDSRRRWTTALSFALQIMAVGLALLLPLIYGEGLPSVLKWPGALVAPGRPPAPPPPVGARPSAWRASNLAANGRLVEPTDIPPHTAEIHEDVGPPPVDPGFGVAYSTGDRRADGVIRDIVSAVAITLPPVAHQAITRPPVISSVMEGNLVRRVHPEYPPLARQAGIQGTVVLQAIISREGIIENLEAVSGHPMLVPAAMAAVRQWRYRPYLLNGAPVEVETQVTVIFVLGGD